MQRFLTVLGYVALGLVGLWLAVMLLDAIDDVIFEITWWLRYRFLPGAIWAAIIGLVIFGISEAMRPGSR